MKPRWSPAVGVREARSTLPGFRSLHPFERVR